MPRLKQYLSFLHDKNISTLLSVYKKFDMDSNGLAHIKANICSFLMI